MVGATESNRPLIGGLTFLGSTVFQIALGLIVSGAVKASGRDRLIMWVEHHVWTALAILLVVSTILTSATLWYRARQDPQVHASAELLDDATRDLATNVAEQVEEAVRVRGLDSPLPIPVRWRLADDLYIDHWTNINVDVTADHPLRLDGQGDDIVRVFRMVPSRRLVVLGDAGAGKSVLMTRFMRSWLREGRAEPLTQVPILFALATWNPATRPLYEWLADELATQHPNLGRRLPDGRSLARAMIDGGRLVYLLDGLDEMPGGLRVQAIRVISESLRPTDNVLLTSRIVEYRTAVTAGGPLESAAAVVLQDLKPEDVVRYLPSTTGSAHSASRWTAVLAEMRRAAPGTPGAALRDVLRTPLMLNLARIAYRDHASQPHDLLTAGNAHTIETLLLDQYLTAALRPSPVARQGLLRSIRRTERYLTQVARYLTDAQTPYFRWWELQDSLSRSDRLRLSVAAGSVATLLSSALYPAIFAIVFSEPMSRTYARFWLFAANYAVPAGATFAVLVAANLHRHGATKARRPAIPVQISWPWTTNDGVRLRSRGHQDILTTALKAGSLVALVNAVVLSVLSLLGLLDPAPDLADAAVVVLAWSAYPALVFASAVWVALEVSGLIEAPARLSEAWSPSALVRSDRNTALLEALLGGVAAALLAGFVAEVGGVLILIINSVARGQPYAPSVGNLIGVALESDFVGTVVLAILVMVFVLTAWGRFTLTRLYLACSGRLPLRLMRFLDVARNAGIMRQTGPAYQFRHLTLQDHLAAGPPNGDGGQSPSLQTKSAGLVTTSPLERTHQTKHSKHATGHDE